MSRICGSNSINELVVSLPLTSANQRLIERYILKKCDISKNQVLAKTRTITSIPFLNSESNQERYILMT